MQIRIDKDHAIDTEQDLRPEERHIVQKLLCYKLLARTEKDFSDKAEKALLMGWNNSGPVEKSQVLAMLIKHLQKEVSRRLQEETNDGIEEE